jgi:hypothetical protein
MVYALGFTNLWGKRVEIFPEFDQATDKHPHCLFLPFFGGDKNEILDFIKTAKKKQTTLKKLQEITDNTKYNFMPVCIESVLNAGQLTELINRNHLLFSIAVFLVKVHPETADDMFWKIAEENFITGDFNVEEATSVLNSAHAKDRSPLGMCKSNEDLKGVCNKSLCKDRKFGEDFGMIESKEKKRALTNVDFGQLYKYDTLNPFYVWEIKATGTEEKSFVQVQFDDIKFLLSQRLAQEQIGKAISSIFLTVRTDVWEKHIHEAMQNLITIEVPLIADSTDAAVITRNIYLFLMEATYPYDEPDCVLQGYVYNKDTAYRFLTESVMVFLHSQKLITKNFNLYMTLTNMGAHLVNEKGLEMWEIFENDTFKRLIESRERIKAIEKKQLVVIDDKKQIEEK